jgi:PKD domain
VPHLGLRDRQLIADEGIVTFPARPFLSRARDPLARAALLAAVAVVATLALMLSAPAYAEVTEISGTKVGLQAVNQSSYTDGSFVESFAEVSEEFSTSFNPGPTTFRNPSGDPVLHGTNVYVVYWDPLARYNPEWQHLINTFMQSMGAASGSSGSVFAVDAQYTDSTNVPAYNRASFQIAYTDTHPYPAKVCTSPGGAAICLTDAQIRTELQGFIAAHSLPKGMQTVYYILTPPSVAVCVDGGSSRCTGFERSTEEIEQNHYLSPTYAKAICSYHSAINPDATPIGDGNTIIYGVVPWTAGTAGKAPNSIVTGQAAYCQGGGWNPSGRPVVQREKIKPRNAQEQKEFEEKSPVEKELLEQLKALQGPHDEEPNQLPCPNLADGECDAGLADLIIGQLATEQQNIVTNPLLNAWQDSSGKEATDECRNVYFRGGLQGSDTANPESGAGVLSNQTLNGHNYYLNMAFDLASTLLTYPSPACIPAANVVPEFTAPNTVNTGETVGFDGMESDVTLDTQYIYSGGTPTQTFAKFRWEFGDGTPAVEGYAPGAPACETPWLSPCAASALHSYQYGGTYQVTLTITDTAGNVASVRHPVTVMGPPPPGPPTATAGGTSGGAAGSATGAATGGAGSHPSAIPAPVAAAAVASHSLRRIRKGISVRYSVNEQVAGHIEVLLSQALARRLRITGPIATGLAAGTPPQVIIGRAILVTTAAGRGTVVVQLSRHVQSRLARLHGVTLMLRMSVRNAASHAPVTTTVLTAFSLGR